MRKWSFKYWLLKWQFRRDRRFLLEKALLKAKSLGLEINVGTRFTCSLDDPEGTIYLPPLGKGVDTSNCWSWSQKIIRKLLKGILITWR